MANETPVIFIEGGIGCGKSTLVKEIQKYCVKNELNICTVQEPVDLWMEIKRTEDGKNIIEAFYEDQEKYAFHFQMMAYISRLHKMRMAMINAQQKEYDLIICERSLETDKKVFCKMLYDEGKIDEFGFQIYNKWFYHFQDFIHKSQYVYLKTSANTCQSRVKKRTRNGEDLIDLDYLERNNSYHDEWLMNESKDKVLVLDGDQSTDDFKNIQDLYDQHITRIFKWWESTQ